MAARFRPDSFRGVLPRSRGNLAPHNPHSKCLGPFNSSLKFLEESRPITLPDTFPPLKFSTAKGLAGRGSLCRSANSNGFGAAPRRTGDTSNSKMGVLFFHFQQSWKLTIGGVWKSRAFLLGSPLSASMVLERGQRGTPQPSLFGRNLFGDLQDWVDQKRTQ